MFITTLAIISIAMISGGIVLYAATPADNQGLGAHTKLNS